MSPIRVNGIVGRRLDPELADRLHRLEHRGLIDTVHVNAADLSRHRFRATSSFGKTVEFALPREQSLFDGAVLLLDQEEALLLRVAAEHWLRLTPGTQADALALGYQAGNLHWRVRFDGDVLLVALDAPSEDYLARLADFTTSGRVRWEIVDGATC